MRSGKYCQHTLIESLISAVKRQISARASGRSLDT